MMEASGEDIALKMHTGNPYGFHGFLLLDPWNPTLDPHRYMCTHVYTYMCTFMYAYMYMCIYICVCVYIYIYIYICTYMYT